MLLCKCKLSFGVAKRETAASSVDGTNGRPIHLRFMYCTANCTLFSSVAFIFKMSGGLEERTASEVHATLCELVTTNAAAHAAWSEYAAVRGWLRAGARTRDV